MTVSTPPRGLSVLPVSWRSSRRLRSERFKRSRHLNLTLRAGDLYVFNSNRLHVVPPVAGTRDRVAFGAFLGYSKDELLVWA